MADWSFLSNYARTRVLDGTAGDPGMRRPDIATMPGITERMHSASSATGARRAPS